MKRILSGKGIFAAVAVLLFALLIWAGVTPPVSASAQEREATPLAVYGTYVYDKYDIDIKVNSDGTANVTERIEADLNNLHGIIRDFALGDGVSYKNITSKCDNADYSPYIESGSSWLHYYMGGEHYVKGKRIYTLEYEMKFEKLKGGYLPINVVGYGNGGEINNVTVRVTVPDGLEKYKLYSGGYKTEKNDYAQATLSGNVITITAEILPCVFLDDEGNLNAAGITLDMQFSPDTFTGTFDFTVLYALLIGFALLGAAALVKIFVCKQPLMTVSVNLEAPDEMDPLMMGYLIDGTVDSEDIGSVVFWLAAEGYLNIQMEPDGEHPDVDKDDPLLVKTEKRMYDSVPAHCRIIYEGLFDMREQVQVSELGEKFYKVTESAKASVTAQKMKTYDTKGKAFAVLFGILTVLLTGGFAWVYSLLTVGAGYHYLAVFITSLIAFVAAATCSSIASRRFYKWKKPASFALICGGVIVGLIISLIIVLFPSAAFGIWTPILLTVFASLTGAVCGFYFCRTKEFTAKLGHILGFKQFITVTEKDRIKVMLEEEPELFYRILPYAQVLGVTDAWTDKFEGLNMAPPSYMHYSGTDFVFDYLIWRSLFRSMNTTLVRNMISRPSSSGRSGRFGGFGGGGGGFGGGFGGGGFGGGGSRGF